MSKYDKAVCSKCSWKSFDTCSMCDLRGERIQSKFKEGQTYNMLSLSNDPEAVRKGRVGQRMWNKWLLKLVRILMKWGDSDD